MADKFVRIGLATGANNGTTAADAWQTESAFATALNGSISPGDTVYYAGNSARKSSLSLSTWSGNYLANVTIIGCYDYMVELPNTQYVEIDGTGSGATVDCYQLNGRSNIEWRHFYIHHFGRDVS